MASEFPSMITGACVVGDKATDISIKPWILVVLLIRSLESLVLSEIFGFILNIPSPVSLGFLSLPITHKHWIAVRQIDGVYYNLDSKLKAPVKLGGPKELKGFLHGCITRGSCEFLLVVGRDVEEAWLWISKEEQEPHQL